ncbi:MULTISPECIES: HNH endonuclease [unclassified Microbacterium]|uniref:HNH endonuclease n=1 Tax=unclassified Microbacterium TaxID=2609290 RepID=UPI000EA9904F|nr:HNH endonuclease [Microbacterium sp. ISL-108]RKN69630.1 HNH endonuclease [Microbacterium sp. CGR2]
MTFPDAASGNGWSSDLATLEHVIPVSVGGSHTWNNCALACAGCNASKGAKIDDSWRIRQGHRLRR